MSTSKLFLSAAIFLTASSVSACTSGPEPIVDESSSISGYRGGWLNAGALDLLVQGDAMPGSVDNDDQIRVTRNGRCLTAKFLPGTPDDELIFNLFFKSTTALVGDTIDFGQGLDLPAKSGDYRVSGVLLDTSQVRVSGTSSCPLMDQVYRLDRVNPPRTSTDP